MDKEKLFQIYQENYSYKFSDKILSFICQLIFYSIIIVEFALNIRINPYLYILLGIIFFYGFITNAKIIMRKPYDDRLADISFIDRNKFLFRSLSLSTDEKKKHPIFNFINSIFLRLSFALGYLLPIILLVSLFIILFIKIF